MSDPEASRATTPLYRRMARKEARIREDQYIALSRLVRVLSRRRTDRSGGRLTENTLIRVAIDLLLSRANRLIGNTEAELRTAVLVSDARPADQADTFAARACGEGGADIRTGGYDRAMEDDNLETPNCPECLHRMEPAGDGNRVHWRCPQCGNVRIS